MQIENETGGVLYTKLLYRIEHGQKDLSTLNIRQLNALLRALEWTPEEFTEATGLELVPSHAAEDSLGTATIQAPTSGAYVRASDEEIIAGRIKKARERLGLSVEEVGERAGVEPDYVAALEEERLPAARMDPAKVAAIFEALGEDFEALVKQGVRIGPERRMRPGERVVPVGYRAAPVLGAAQAGKPADFAELVPEREWRPTTAVFHVEGDSMEPTLFEGDVVYVDTALTEPIHGHIYVVEILGDGYTVKRAIRTQNGEWLLASDNPAYPALKPSEARIVGEVYRAKGERDLRI